MRGGYLHNCVLLDPIEAHFLALGAATRREWTIRVGERTCFIDLMVELVDSRRIACEAELTADRIVRDIEKAVAAGASLLLIVVPSTKVARAARQAARKCCRSPQTMPVWILPLGGMRQRLRSCFPLISTTIDLQKSEQQRGVEQKEGRA